MKGNSAVPVMLVAVLAAAAAKELSNTWVAEIDGGEESARLVAKQLGLRNTGAPGSMGNGGNKIDPSFWFSSPGDSTGSSGRISKIPPGEVSKPQNRPGVVNSPSTYNKPQNRLSSSVHPVSSAHSPDEEYGTVNAHGEVITPAKFTPGAVFGHGNKPHPVSSAHSPDEEYGTVNAHGEVITPAKFTPGAVFGHGNQPHPVSSPHSPDEEYGTVNAHGEVITPAKFTPGAVFGHGNQPHPVSSAHSPDEEYGTVNAHGEVITPAKFTPGAVFGHGNQPHPVSSPHSPDEEYGTVNAHGEVITPAMFTPGASFADDVHKHGSKVNGNAGNQHGSKVNLNAGNQHGSKVNGNAGNQHGSKVNGNAGNQHGSKVNGNAGNTIDPSFWFSSPEDSTGSSGWISSPGEVSKPQSRPGVVNSPSNHNQPQTRPDVVNSPSYNPGSVNAGGEIFTIPSFSSGGSFSGGNNAMWSTFGDSQPQGDVSKLGTFSTKPNYDSLSTYEGPTKNFNLQSTKTSAYKSKWNDPLWTKQWYLQDYRTTNGPVMDLNVVPVWNANYNGEGIVVGVVDDGVEGNHPDLKENYLEEDSYDYGFERPGAKPDTNEQTGKLAFHGTHCAGEIVMVAGNDYCGVGIAYKAKIIGIKSLAKVQKFTSEGMTQIHKLEKIDIYSNSWGPDDDGKTMEKMIRPTELALTKGVIKGRNGKGALYLTAAGNGKHDHDNCAADYMVNNINMIAVAPVSQGGKATFYGERCTAIFCAAYSSSYAQEERIISTDVNGRCTTSATGTSAATPLVTGILALVLQANNKLTYRDVWHLITMGSEVAPVANNGDIWYRNAKGFWVSNDFGFGLINAENMVNLAKNWVNVPKQTSCTVSVTLNRPLQFAVGKVAEISFDANACQNTQDAVKYLETVVITTKVQFPYRGALAMNLTSPQGTRSNILQVRPKDNNEDGLDNWGIKSVHNWGEDPKGTWKLEVRATALGGRHLAGAVESFSLTFYGTATQPAHHTSMVPRKYSDFRLPNGKASTDPM